MVSFLLSLSNIYEEGDTLMTCSVCQTKQCLSRRTPPYSEISCIQNRWEQCYAGFAEDAETAEWIHMNMKPCQCGHRIRKDGDDCDRMVCPGCGSRFCWICLADYDTI